MKRIRLPAVRTTRPLLRPLALATAIAVLAFWPAAPVLAAPAAAAVAATATGAALVLEPQTMDRSADPCTDFFQYANGTWLASNPVPPDRSRYTAYDEVSERNLTALRALVEQAGPDQGSAARLVGNYYKSGMDEAAIEAAGSTPLAAELGRIAALRNRAELPALLAHLHATGINALFGFGVDQDAKNTVRYIPQLGQGGLGLPDRDYYLKNDVKTRAIRTKYVAHMRRMFGLLGETPAAAARDAATVLALETRLARASLSKVALRDPQQSYHLTTLDGLKKIAPQTDWPAYFTGVGLPAPGEFNVGQPSFFKATSGLLATVPLDQWQAYLRWNLINATASDLSNAFVNEDFDFKGRTLAGTKELQPRWKRVLTTVDGNVGEALGELYVAKFFGPAAKAAALDMVGNIKQAMRETINELPWMTAPTKTEALRKLDTIVVKIGYPDRWRDYASLTIEPGGYLDNSLRAAQFEFRRNLAKLGTPIDRGEWGMTPPTVNAYYNPTMNEMVFPAGILQPPLFHVDADAAANYGNTGATIGHELTHAFDDEGRQFDASGNLKSWWSKVDEAAFLKRVKTIEAQYDEIEPIAGVRINGKLTAGENIADLGGLKIALRALQMAQKTRPQPQIDGLTPEQRFFVANAQSFRANIRPEQLRLQLATNPHAPEKYRVIAPFANMPEFAAAFSCPAERSPLRPENKRVVIW
ncbi:MAG: M13 family metallopeptidase [Herminiimonas sp.]|nr:M13 family metallopeptidase [Herminiimonas sp.]